MKNKLRTGQSPSSQDLDNLSFDDEVQVYMQEIVGSPEPVGSPSRSLYAVKVFPGGGIGTTPIAGTSTNRYDLQSPVYYVGEAEVGSDEADPVWVITKYDLTTNPYSGKVATDTAWSGRTGATYE